MRLPSNCIIASVLLHRRLTKAGYRAEIVIVETRREYWWSVKAPHHFVRVKHHEIGYHPHKTTLGNFPSPLFFGRLKFGKYI